jgi:hypothetical protein
MLSLTEIFAIIRIHWIADFVFQAEKWALGKSKNWKDLLSHTSVYTLFWWPSIMVLYIFYSSVLPVNAIQVYGFVLVTFIAHTTTDYFTSRITSARYKSNHFYGFNGFWFWIGLDQILHYVQLFLTYHLLK